jgi:hypothetical protein
MLKHFSCDETCLNVNAEVEEGNQANLGVNGKSMCLKLDMLERLLVLGRASKF